MAYEKTYANGYTFAVDETTGTIIATGELQNTMAERNQYVMAKTGGDMKIETDHAGHIIAARENGPCIPENLAAQDSKLNLSTYKKVENAEYRIMKDGGEIQTERIAYMSNPKTEQGVRPDCFMVNDKITYSDGNIQEVHLSFTNMTYGQQEAINRELENTVPLDNSLNVNDTIRNEMSSQEIEETNQLLSNIGDEFEEQISYTPEIEEGVEVNTQDDWNFEAKQSVESDIQVESDWNFQAESDNDMDIGQSVSDEVSGSVETDSMGCSTDNSTDIGGIDCGTDSSADIC